MKSTRLHRASAVRIWRFPLERLEALCERRLTRIGLSATQKPIEEIARFLTGSIGADQAADCEIVDFGYSRSRDLAIELPAAPLEAVMSGDVWQQEYARLAELIQQHRTTLVFVNTRRMAERAARHLSELLGKDAVTSHHGSLAREQRLAAEQRLKRGELRALVATSSLELGIDIGDVDLVCQLASPRSISAFLQRAGRSATPSAARPRAACFRCRATIWSSVRGPARRHPPRRTRYPARRTQCAGCPRPADSG